MQAAIQTIRYSVAHPLKTSRFVIRAHIRLWSSSFWEAWYAMPFYKKITWIAFISQTLGILTLIELIFVKQ